MSAYKQPRRLNWVSIPVYAAIAAAIYGGVKFGPPCYRNMKVDEVVRAAVNEYWYQVRGATDTSAPQELRDRTEQKIRNLGVDDPAMALTFEHDTDDLRVTASYRVVVTHPFVSRTTTLRFAPTAATSVIDKRQ